MCLTDTAGSPIQSGHPAHAVHAEPRYRHQHQRRLHLNSIDYSILGCDLYVHEEALHGEPRLMLHPCGSTFKHPGGHMVSCNVENTSEASLLCCEP